MTGIMSRRFFFIKAAIITAAAIVGMDISLANAGSPTHPGTSNDYNWMAGGGG